MLANLKRRLKDMSTLRQVFLKAEACARAEGATEPGSEHLVLAALELADETAPRAFSRVGADPAEFSAAVAQQYTDALRRIGIDVGSHLTSADELPDRPDRAGLFRSQPSARTLMTRLARDRPFGFSKPLLGADIVLAALSNDIGTAARALAVMGVEPDQLADACWSEIAAHDGVQ